MGEAASYGAKVHDSCLRWPPPHGSGHTLRARRSAPPAEERSALGRNGLEYVKKHHDTRALAEKLEAVMAEVVARDGI